MSAPKGAESCIQTRLLMTLITMFETYANNDFHYKFPKKTFTHDKHWQSFLIHCQNQIKQVGLEWVLAISLMTQEGLT